MRRIRIVKSISSKHLVHPETREPVTISMVEWLEEKVLADSGWQDGNENEAAARLAACERIQDAFDGAVEGDTVTLTDGDHEYLDKIARSKSFLLHVLQAKEKRFMAAIAGCERFKEEPAAEKAVNGAAEHPPS